MPRLPVRNLVLATFGLAGLCLTPAGRAEQDLAKAKWVKSTAYVVPKETATEGEGYFSIIEGLNGRLYIGTHANAVNSWLVEFDPVAEKMKVVTDAHKAIGKDLKGFGAQAKIHTRNNVGASGKIYFGTKQGYPDTQKGGALLAVSLTNQNLIFGIASVGRARRTAPLPASAGLL